MNLLQGGNFSLPIKDLWDPAKPNELLRQQFYFCKRVNGETIEDCFPKLKLTPVNDPKVHYRLLETDNLEPGDYELKVHGSNPFSMDITVHMGSIWNNVENFIQKKTSITEIMQSQKVIKVQESEIQDAGKSIKLKLSDFTEDARVHVFATKFFQPDYTPLY